MENNNNQTWMGVVIIGLLVIGGFWYMSMNQKTVITNPVATTTPTPVTTVPVGSPKASTAAAQVVDKNLISITKNTYVPGSLTVKVGETVTWVNNDSYTHTVVADDQTFSSTNLATGAKYSYTFTKDGTFTYTCSIHPSMKGTIIVTK